MVEEAAAADEASPDGEASSGRGKRVQRSRRPTLAVLEASAGELSDDGDAAAEPGPADGAANEEDLQDYEPDGMTAAPTSPPPSAKRKRSRARQVSAAAEDEAGVAEAALNDGPQMDASSALPTRPEDLSDAMQAVPEPSQAELSPAEAPPSAAKGQRTRARQPPAKFQPTFSPDRPAAKRASAATAAVKAGPPAAAKAAGGSGGARRSRGSAVQRVAQRVAQAAPGDAGTTDGVAAADVTGAPASGTTVAADSDAPVKAQPAAAGASKQGGRRKQGGNAPAASPRQANSVQCPFPDPA